MMNAATIVAVVVVEAMTTCFDNLLHNSAVAAHNEGTLMMAVQNCYTYEDRG
jgi:hypothetical protein